MAQLLTVKKLGYADYGLADSNICICLATAKITKRADTFEW